MTPPRISVILPTVGRATLGRTLDSIVPQMCQGDEIIAVCDGSHAKDRVELEKLRIESGKSRFNGDIAVYEYQTPPQTPKPWVGQPQRRYALDNRLASGDLIMWMGDDDVMRPGSLSAVRECAEEYPERVILCKFKAWWPGRPVLWSNEMPVDDRFREGWLSDHSIISPNIPEKLGQFGLHYQGDFQFLSETVERFGGIEKVVWLDYVCAVMRPE